MRIISGEFRGRKILPPQGEVTRPITDRVKQSLFDILTPLLPDATVYDVFAGTGSMGLEALSRGAARATFFEKDKSALSLLRKNIVALGLADRTRVIASDLFQWFASPASRPAANSLAQLVFLDPPYKMVVGQGEDLRRLADSVVRHHLASDGTLVFRHDARDQLTLPGLERYDQREYGGMTIEFLRPVPAVPGNGASEPRP
jgi:16S rRNA (guanine966-N2)-methyltransferase